MTSRWLYLVQYSTTYLFVVDKYLSCTTAYALVTFRYHKYEYGRATRPSLFLRGSGHARLTPLHPFLHFQGCITSLLWKRNYAYRVPCAHGRPHSVNHTVNHIPPFYTCRAASLLCCGNEIMHKEFPVQHSRPHSVNHITSLPSILPGLHHFSVVEKKSCIQSSLGAQ